jgi:hypothetical protein
MANPKASRGRSRNAALRVQTLSEFVSAVATLRSQWFDEEDPWGPWFRGQQRDSWGLLPKILRAYGNYKRIKKDRIEDEIREEFAARAPVLSDAPAAGINRWNWYFHMQHFGAPTRLLDWTEGAHIALYFAVRDNPEYYDAAVWVLDPYELNRLVTGREEVIPPSEPDTADRDRRLVDPWLPERFARGTMIPDKPVAVYPTHITRRISTQRSCFTVHGSDPAGLDKLHGNRVQVLAKITIPSFRVRSIRKEFETQGIDEVTVFPDLDGLGRALCARWRLDSPMPPHTKVYTRLRPSSVANGGVGVFAIRRIKKGTPLFPGDNEEVLWVRKKDLSNQPRQIRRLYEDFAVSREGRFGCPQNFNRLTVAWYLNEPAPGQAANVRCVEETLDLFALRDIREGEELTVDYSTYSDLPISATVPTPTGASRK